MALCRVLESSVFTSHYIYSAKLSSHFFGGKDWDDGSFIQNDSSIHTQDAGYLLGSFQASLPDMESLLSNHYSERWPGSQPGAGPRPYKWALDMLSWTLASATWKAWQEEGMTQGSGAEACATVLPGT